MRERTLDADRVADRNAGAAQYREKFFSRPETHTSPGKIAAGALIDRDIPTYRTQQMGGEQTSQGPADD